jgi:hypothetical protein
MYKRGLGDTINAFGKEITIFYRTSTADATIVLDPINNEPVDPTSSTASGFGRVYSEEEIKVKAVVQKFAGNLSYYREGQPNTYQVQPDGDARITMKLEDVLVNVNVSTSATYFKDCQKVIADGDYYRPKDWKRFGIKDLYLIEVTLERIREETP